MLFQGGQIWGIEWVIKKLEALVGHFRRHCKCPVSRSIVVQEQDPLGELPTAFFLQKVLQLPQQRYVILHVDSLALWKLINEGDAVFITKKKAGEKFERILVISEFLGGMG